MSKWIVWLGQDYITHNRPALEVIQTNKTQIGRPKQTDKAQIKIPKFMIDIDIMPGSVQ